MHDASPLPPLAQIPSNVHDAYAAVFEQLWPSGVAGQQVQQVGGSRVDARDVCRPSPFDADSYKEVVRLTGALVPLIPPRSIFMPPTLLTPLLTTFPPPSHRIPHPQVLEVLVAAQEPPPLSLLANLKLASCLALPS